MNQKKGTKVRLFETALDMFANHSYHTISMRDLAQEVGITPPSIYNHFASKEELLHTIYEYFDSNMTRLMPDLQELLDLVGHMHPHKILMKTNFIYPSDIMDNMARAMLITTSMMRIDPLADELIFKNLVRAPYKYDPPLLRKMLDMDLIEPLDIDSYAFIHSSFCHSTVVCFYSDHMVQIPDWWAGLKMIHEIVKVKDEGRY